MKRKKLLALVCAALTALSLAACGKAENDVDVASGPEDVTLVLSRRDERLSDLADAANDAANEIGVNLTVVDCDDDASKGVQFVETARNAGENVVIVNLTDPSQARSVIDAAGGMKIVFVNCPPDNMDCLNKNVAYVGSNDMEAGRYQGEALAAYFQTRGQTEVRYVLLNGAPGGKASANRTLSVLQALSDNGVKAVEATAPLEANSERAKAMDLVTSLLTSGLAFDCIIANNDAMALGAVEALEAAGMDPSETPVAGIDGDADAIAAVAAGRMYMTVLQNADAQGGGAVRAAVNLLNGVPVGQGTGFDADPANPYVLWVPFERVDAENVANYGG